ncbi:ATP-binding protein [Candidatus Woesearchaeota archaeon]|nr:ATP-binding protein [Candidatus Woesearchaeota archaeon]
MSLVTKSDFVLEWDKALGFKGDPFVDKIFTPINKFLVDRTDEKEKLNWFFIKNYFFGAIIGEQGVGKTTMMRWLEDRLKKYNRIHGVYINAALFKEQVNILQTMIIPLLTFYEKSFSKPHTKLPSSELLGFLKKKLGHKSVALLIDNAHYLTEKNLALIKSLRKEKIRFRVVIASTPKEYEKSRLRELGSDELSITLRRLTFDEEKEMLKKRIEAFGGKEIHPFLEEDLKKVYDKADKNPKKFLKLCRDGAIKILIHKREMLEKKGFTEEQAKPLKVSLKKSKVSDEKMDVRVRKASRKEAAEEKKDDKKKLFKIRFDFSKEEDKPRKKHAHPAHHRRAIHDEEHKQELLNQMKSTSPRRSPVKEEKKKRDDEHISETDKLLKELAEEFEVD